MTGKTEEIKVLKGHTMFKSIIAAAAIATATFVTPASAALPLATCKVLGTLIENSAVLRDAGYSSTEVYELLTLNGVTPAVAVNLIEIVYITGKGLDGSVLNPLFVGNCVGES
mgnify:CR=1 FL=1